MSPSPSEMSPAKRGALLFLAVLAVVFGGLLLGEWYFRFARYHWEMQIVNLPPPAPETLSVKEVGLAFVTNLTDASRGGDLTALVGLQRFAQSYMEDRPAGYRIIDAQGFVNRDHDPSLTPEIVVVGDSFMTVGDMDETFASQLAQRSGGLVYNRAMLGHGPFVSLEGYLDDPAHVHRPPKFLVWGFAEREINPKTFQRLYYSMTWRQEITRNGEIELERLEAQRNVYVHWKNLAPAQLKESLPATSIIAQSAQWVWNRASCLVFGRLHPDLIPSRTDVIDGPMLFYRYHIEAIDTRFTQEDVSTVARAVDELNRLCRRRGMTLIVVLIPEKEQVYRDWIPARYNSEENPLPPEPLGGFEEALRQQGVRVVNLLPVFKQAAATGRRVYWRDDTHWNPEGISLAAEEVWRAMRDAGSGIRDAGYGIGEKGFGVRK